MSIQIQLPAGSSVEWSVFTTAFRKVAGGSQDVSGNNALTWDLKDQNGASVADGLYYIRVKAVVGTSTTVKILKILIFR